MSEDAAFQILAKRLTDIRLWGVVVALAVKLAGTCQRVPGLEVLGYGLVQQRTFGVARVVELGLCTRWATRVRNTCVGRAVAGMGQCQRGVGA